MPTQTSLFLPDNAFIVGGTYAASLVGSNGNTSTLAIHCTAAPSQTSAGCGPSAVTNVITVAPTTFAMTTLSPNHEGLVTIFETCTLAPTASTAVCNITALGGLYAPFHVDKREYVANVHPMNITNVAATQTAATTTSSALTATSNSSAVISTSTSSAPTATTTTPKSLGTKAVANGKSGAVLLALCAMFAVIRI